MERQVLLDAILVGRMDRRAAAQAPPAFRVFGLHQMPPAGALAQYFATGSNLKPLGGRFLRFDSLRPSHINPVSFEKERAI